MADQPIPFPSARELAEPPNVSHSPTRSFEPKEPARLRMAPEWDIAVLRERLKIDGLDLDAVLDQIVRHAQALTGSNGAAIALHQGPVILCRARCGETSPSLNAPLDADFGISGECLRTGKALRCEDSEIDLRLDTEVCRQLGLRSIAVVPIFERTTVAGILEVFGAQPHAFNDQHLRTLQRLAELVTNATQRVTGENQDLVSEGILAFPREVTHELPVAKANPRAASSHGDRQRRWTSSIASWEYYGAGIAILALAALLTILVWKPWPRTETIVQSTKTLTNAAPMETRPRLSIAEVPAIGQRDRTQRAVSPSPRNLASMPEAHRVARVRPRSGKDESNNPIVVPYRATQTRDRIIPADAKEPLPPIQLIGTAAGFVRGKNVMDAPVSVPASLPIMVSQGVSGGLLERKVDPKYPAAARSSGLQGPVVLQAVIDEVGKVRDLTTVSGNSILAQAAMDAVRQWRYQPYRLNGQPVKVPTKITVNFSLP